jgi:hypothetical protein
VQVVSATTDRGPGCVSSGQGTLRCNLDWLSSDAPYGNITIVSNVKAAGELVLTSTVAYSRADSNPSNNSLTLKANTPPVVPPTPPPAAAAPKLTYRQPATAPVLRASRSGRIATVGTIVAVDQGATVTLSVTNPRTGKRLTLRAGSKLATTTLTKPALAARSRIAAARAFTIKALVPGPQVKRGATYQMVLTATNNVGKTSKLTIRFLGG